ncbi:hypothetical protein EBB07_13775 [Paenibacillaceae bacterium]|nr:hypothetical protein EBB07_13775 [Paenibacillaceae bacterium]
MEIPNKGGSIKSIKSFEWWREDEANNKKRYEKMAQPKNQCLTVKLAVKFYENTSFIAARHVRGEHVCLWSPKSVRSGNVAN